MTSPPVWTAPSAVLHSRPRQLTTSVNSGGLFIGRMLSPTIAGPDLCHGSRFHAARQLRLRGELGQLSQERWDTTPDNPVIHGRKIKINERLSTGANPSGPRPLPPEPPELAQVGAKFHEIGQSTSATADPWSERARGRHQRRTLMYDSETPSPQMICGNLPENTLDPITSREGASLCGSTLGDRQSYTQANNHSNHAQGRKSPIGPPLLTGQSDSELLLQGSPGPALQPPGHPEFPDLFYAFDPEKYEPYQQECSHFYKDFPEFMRRGLEKHRGHFEREGIPLKVFERAMKVPPPRGKPIEEKIESWYLNTRHAFFGIPTTEGIMACKDPGKHELAKGTRSRRKRDLDSEPAGKRPRISRAAPITTNGTSFTNPDAGSTAMPFAGIENGILAMPGVSQPLSSTLNTDGEYPYAIGTRWLPHTPSVGQPDATRDHGILGQQIQQISMHLSAMYQSLLANSTADVPWEYTTSFEHLIQQITNSLNTYLAYYPGITTLPTTNSQLSVLFAGSYQVSTSSTSSHPNNLYSGVHMPSSDPVLTPDGSTVYSAYSGGNISGHHGPAGFPDYGPTG